MQKRLGNLILLKTQNLKEKEKEEAPFEDKLQRESGLVSLRFILKGRVTYLYMYYTHNINNYTFTHLCPSYLSHSEPLRTLQ